jgi:hypothetical protein
MIKIVRSLLIVLFIASYSLPANSETSWITKKDKTKKTLVKKTETKAKKSEWIKKKKEKKEEVKKNKKKFKEKIKESKSWITKKSKDKLKKIKTNLEKYKDVNSLPKAEFYFAAIIEPKEENEEAVYLYGYVNSDTKSEKFKFNNKSYHSKSDGIGFIEDGKTTCEVDSQIGTLFGDMLGKVVVKCKNGIEMAGKFTQTNQSGKGTDGSTNKGNNVEFEFYTSKDTALAKLKYYKENKETIITRSLPDPKNNKNIKLEPNGKYYALLIGNSKYESWASLTSPVNDVNEIGKILKSDYNFEKVMMVKNGNKKDIFKKLKELSNITTDKDYVLIYYSGHGDERGNQRYWIPVDGEKEYGFGDWININDIQVYIQEEISNTHLVMMSDSCYFAMETKGNQIQKDKKSQSYQKLLERRAVIVVGSGSNEPVSDTSQKKHSMFGMSFIQSLKNNSNAIRMRDIVENIILSHSGMQQQPYGIGIGAWGHSGGDFIFIKNDD